MSIIPPLPFTLTNGTVADASQVQADLDQIRNSVNTLSTNTPIFQTQVAGLSANSTVFVLPARAMVLEIIVENTGGTTPTGPYLADFAQVTDFQLNGNTNLPHGTMSRDVPSKSSLGGNSYAGVSSIASNFVLHSTGWNGAVATVTVLYLQF